MPLIRKNLADGTTRTEFEIDDAELIGIGRVTVQWAYLEHGVYAITYGMAGSTEALPKDALSTSFKRRLRAMRLMAEETLEGDECARLLRLISRIANAEQDRHKITHGMWEWDVANPERIAASSFRPGYEFEKIYDAARMNQLADEIGQINFAMEYPGGLKQDYSEWADHDGQVAYASRSRKQRREMKEGLDRYQLDDDPTKPPIR